MTLTNQYSWQEICDKKVAELKRAGKLQKQSDEKNFRDWFMSKEKLGIAFDTLLIYKCWRIQKRLKKKYDNIIVIAGSEGTGKSILALNICAWVSPDFNKENIVFHEGQYFDNLSLGDKGESIDIDEGAVFLFTRDTMQRTNKNIIKSFTVIRAKSLNVIICVPNFHILDNYIKEHRTRLLIQIFKRGHYIAFNKEAIRIINEKGTKHKQVLGIKVPNGTFWHGSCNYVFPPQVPEAMYEELKMEHMNQYIKQAREEVTSSNIKFLPAAKVAREISMTSDGLIGLIKRGEVEGKQIGKYWYVSMESYKRLLEMV